MTDSLPPLNTAVLVGNGLSIAFNPELNLALITQEMIRRMASATVEGDKIVHAMNEIARRAVTEGEVTNEDFEKLVGAFDSQVLTLEELSKLAELVASEDSHLHGAIRDVSAFSQRVRDMGISYVLEVIMERSRGDWVLHDEMHKLIRAITDRFRGTVHIANLNYDTLLLSALQAIGAPMADMGHGLEQVQISVRDMENPADEGTAYRANRLRTEADFPSSPNNRVRLLHLHGSLTYWRNTSDGTHYKVPISALRNHSMLAGLREGNPQWRPAVVLANQRDKAHHVGRYPFKLAYEAFEAGLVESQHWLIIGYSFRDKCVNDMLREQFIRRNVKPQVLVSTYGDELTSEEVELALGWGAEDPMPNDWLTIARGGAKGLQDTWEWVGFTS